MRRDPRKYLFDILTAADLLIDFTAGKTLEDYLDEAMLRAAVEREFEIIGEAISGLSRVDPAIPAKISQNRRIVSFRNTLIHGYDQVDDRIVRDIVATDLPTLRAEVAAALAELDDATAASWESEPPQGPD